MGLLFVFFFFQAEDGIRDLTVTGVQTCALPLLIVFIAIDLIAGLVAGAVTILQARASTRVEIAASMELAELLVREAVGPLPPEGPAGKNPVRLPPPTPRPRAPRGRLHKTYCR